MLLNDFESLFNPRKWHSTKENLNFEKYLIHLVLIVPSKRLKIKNGEKEGSRTIV